MLHNSLAISLIVIFIQLTMQEEEIFGFIGVWFKKNLPNAIHKPVFDCPVCMTPWYGSIIMWAAIETNIFQPTDIWHWIFTLAIASGISTVYAGMKPKKEININEKSCGL